MGYRMIIRFLLAIALTAGFTHPMQMMQQLVALVSPQKQQESPASQAIKFYEMLFYLEDILNRNVYPIAVNQDLETGYNKKKKAIQAKCDEIRLSSVQERSVCMAKARFNNLVRYLTKTLELIKEPHATLYGRCTRELSLHIENFYENLFIKSLLNLPDEAEWLRILQDESDPIGEFCLHIKRLKYCPQPTAYDEAEVSQLRTIFCSPSIDHTTELDPESWNHWLWRNAGYDTVRT